MKNGQNGSQPILSVFQSITIDTMLNKKRAVKQSNNKRAKNDKCEQSFSIEFLHNSNLLQIYTTTAPGNLNIGITRNSYNSSTVEKVIQ